MQLSPRTLAILKNFSNINPGIIIDPGKFLRTCSPNADPHIFAIATLEDGFQDIPSLGIANIQQFLGILSSFETPDLRFGEKYLVVSQGNQKVQYVYGEKSLIKSPSGDEVEMPKAFQTFKLSQADLEKLTRISNVMTFPNVAIMAEKGKASIRGLDAKNPTTNVYQDEIGDATKAFTVMFTIDQFNALLSMDYEISVAKGITKLAGKDVTYYFAPQDKYCDYGESK